jgi:type IV secretory pathway VirB10-like protein
MATSKAHIRATAKYEKNNYFKTLVRFKKEDEERIRNAAGDSLNGFIVKCVLDKLNSEESTAAAGTTPDTESVEITPVEPETPEPPKPLPDTETPENTPENGLKPLTIEDIQAMLDNRKADEIRMEKERQERKEQEEQERRNLLANPEYAATYAQLMAMETAEKEKKRAETLTRARLETI